MRNRNKYLLGVALGFAAFGLGLVFARGAPKIKTRMEGHCREMMDGLVKAKDREREGELVA